MESKEKNIVSEVLGFKKSIAGLFRERLTNKNFREQMTNQILSLDDIIEDVDVNALLVLFY